MTFANGAADQHVALADPEAWFHRLATHFVEAQIYFHLNQCGVFQKLHDRASAADIASILDLDERILRSLLEYVADVGEIVETDGCDLFGLTPFGQGVIRRYGRVNGERTTYNLFDVRVGAWGPVWVNLGDMLSKKKVYGTDFHRAGGFAADGLFKLAAPLMSAVERAATRLGATTIVEIGPTSGILAQLACEPGGRNRRYVGLDIRQESLDAARELAEERGVNSISWRRGDILKPSGWLQDFSADDRVMYFSCHFHEFLSHGLPEVEQALRLVTLEPNTAGLLVLEQARLDPQQRAEASQSRWLYAQSNVLIHHLIKNARILHASEWSDLLRAAGCSDVWVEETRGFGFDAFTGATTAACNGNVDHV